MARPKQAAAATDATKPIFALKPPKRPALPRHSVGMRPDTLAALDQYVTWASGALGVSYDEAQSQFLEVAVLELIGKDGAYKSHLKTS